MGLPKKGIHLAPTHMGKLLDGRLLSDDSDLHEDDADQDVGFSLPPSLSLCLTDSLDALLFFRISSKNWPVMIEGLTPICTRTIPITLNVCVCFASSCWQADLDVCSTGLQ